MRPSNSNPNRCNCNPNCIGEVTTREELEMGGATIIGAFGKPSGKPVGKPKLMGGKAKTRKNGSNVKGSRVQRKLAGNTMS